ncbi:MAG: hypothetical protein AAF721_28150 [Myxococcota bacterium]
MSWWGDRLWFVGPGIVAAAVGLAIAAVDPRDEGYDESLALWIVGVLLVDVAHVYASLYRTYFDPVARQRHRARLIWAPILVAWFSFLLHLESPLLFWGALAYVAIFHFIKQHVGFAMLYARGGHESATDRRLVASAVWAGTLAPVVWWHSRLPRQFAWFAQGDLVVGLPTWVGPVALLATVPIWLAFAWRRGSLWRAGRGNPMVVWLTVVPAINWYLGIVVFNDDRIFTVTNVILHGVPYFALVWVAGGRACVEQGLGRITKRGVPPALLVALAFYGLLLALAVGEEALWDRLIWHERAVLFGDGGTRLSPYATAAITALLTVPQATHYLLDRWIWRAGPDNPALARQLGFAPREAPR